MIELNLLYRRLDESHSAAQKAVKVVDSELAQTRQRTSGDVIRAQRQISVCKVQEEYGRIKDYFTKCCLSGTPEETADKHQQLAFKSDLKQTKVKRLQDSKELCRETKSESFVMLNQSLAEVDKQFKLVEATLQQDYSKPQEVGKEAQIMATYALQEVERDIEALEAFIKDAEPEVAALQEDMEQKMKTGAGQQFQAQTSEKKAKLRRVESSFADIEKMLSQLHGMCVLDPCHHRSTEFRLSLCGGAMDGSSFHLCTGQGALQELQSSEIRLKTQPGGQFVFAADGEGAIEEVEAPQLEGILPLQELLQNCNGLTRPKQELMRRILLENLEGSQGAPDAMEL